MSPELQTLLLSYRVVFLEAEATEFRNMYRNSDPERLMKLATYHGVRPVLYQALKKVGIDDSFTRSLQFFASQMAMRDKLNGLELSRLLKILSKAGIEALPYKGFLFTENLYGGQHFRESGDMDLLIREKNQGVKAIGLLCEEGYQLQVRENVKELIDDYQGREVTLIKKDRKGLEFHLDFHWGVNEMYHSYALSQEDLFEGSTVQTFLGEEVLLPSDRAIFKMLLNHHGGRDCWLKLKELFDFSVFLKKYASSDNNWEEIAKEIKMERIFHVGRNLNDTVLLEVNSEKIRKGSIIKYWEIGKVHNKKFGSVRIKYLNIYFSMQDKSVSRPALLWKYIQFLGAYSPANDNYYRPFKGKSNFLNSVVKGLTIFYRMARGTYKVS